MLPDRGWLPIYLLGGMFLMLGTATYIRTTTPDFWGKGFLEGFLVVGTGVGGGGDAPFDLIGFWV